MSNIQRIRDFLLNSEFDYARYIREFDDDEEYSLAAVRYWIERNLLPIQIGSDFEVDMKAVRVVVQEIMRNDFNEELYENGGKNLS